MGKSIWDSLMENSASTEVKRVLKDCGQMYGQAKLWYARLQMPVDKVPSTGNKPLG